MPAPAAATKPAAAEPPPARKSKPAREPAPEAKDDQATPGWTFNPEVSGFLGRMEPGGELRTHSSPGLYYGVGVGSTLWASPDEAVRATLLAGMTRLKVKEEGLGGPLVEATHDDLKFTAPLTAITAAVVGVIVNLALFFGWHVLWPSGRSGPFEWPAALIAVAAAIALFRFKRGVIEVIAGCALVGLAVHWATH